MRFGNASARHAAEVLSAVTVCLSESDEASIGELAALASRILRSKEGAVSVKGERLTSEQGLRLSAENADAGVPLATKVMWATPHGGTNREIVGVLETFLSLTLPTDAGLADLLVRTLQLQASPIRDWLESSGAFRKLSDPDSLATVQRALDEARAGGIVGEALVIRFLVLCGYPSEMARHVFDFRDQAASRKSKAN